MTAIYYAVWWGRPETWAYLYTTTENEQDAQQFVSTIEGFGHPAYYTVEEGPIVPVAPSDIEDGRCYCCGDEYGHDPDPMGIFHINEQVLALARKERGE